MSKPSKALTLIYWLGVTAVAVTAFLASYSHILEVALVGGQSTLVARLLPVSIDGMMVVASVRIAKDKAAGLHPTGWAKFGLIAGVLVSLACNVADIIVKRGVDVLAIGIAAVAPLMLALVIEIITKPGKPVVQATATEPETAKDLPTDAPVSPAVGGPVEQFERKHGRRPSERHTRRLVGSGR